MQWCPGQRCRQGADALFLLYNGVIHNRMKRLIAKEHPMKTKLIVSALASIALSACLTCAFAAPASASAGDAASGRMLTTSSVEAQSTAKAKAPIPKAVRSLNAVFENGGTIINWPRDSKNPNKYVTVSWKAPKTVKGLKSQTYSVRYATSPYGIQNAKVKTTSKTSISIRTDESVYVQIRTNAKYGKKTVHSKWSTWDITLSTGGGSSFTNGVRYDYDSAFLDVTDRDAGKPGSWEAAMQARVPRSLKLSSPKAGTVKVSWKEPKNNKSKYDDYGYSLKYAVRYSYSKNMKNAKEKEEITGTSYTLKGLKRGKAVYVQVCAMDASVDFSNNVFWNHSSRWTNVQCITPQPKAVSQVKLSSESAGNAAVSWKASKVKGLKSQTYTVRYAYDKSMKGAKTKTTTKKSLSLAKLKRGNTLYVQVRTNAKFKNKKLHSKWSKVKKVQVMQQWVEEQGHWESVCVQEAWDEEVATTTEGAEQLTTTVHHDAVYENRWVVDSPGHWE